MSPTVEQLRLERALDNVDALLDRAGSGDLTTVDVLDQLPGAELAARRERSIAMRLPRWPLQTVPAVATSKCTSPSKVVGEGAVLLSGCFRLPLSRHKAGFVEPIAFAAHLDEVAMMHEPIEKCGDGGCIAEELGPIFERAV